jgi:hypothetical protein
MNPILIEGFTTEEILALPDDYFDSYLVIGRPFIFRIGTANILGEFRQTSFRLTIELGHIDGGGEGVLPTLGRLIERYAHRRNFAEVEWIVHAVNCANPNPKLRRVLERSGFAIRTIEGSTDAYYKLVNRTASHGV